ncbi:MAG: PPC domain-containing protein [Verrucomicrobiales bacterium]|nr:PPC domain-containing protein [Verrucomicrobiales bacterium]
MRGPAIVSALLFAALPAIAAVPALESVFPAGGKQGAEIDVTLSGKIEPWPCAIWFSEKGLTFTPDPAKAGTGKIRIEASVKPGPVYLRAHNAEGASPPLLFIVGDQTEINEEEKDNSTLAGAIALDRAKLPFVINGTLSAGGELDVYRLPLEKGETLHARVEGYGLRSLIDPALHLHDAAGNRLILQHDGPANLDPGFTFTAPEKGDYLISLAGFSHPPAASVAYTGSKNSHYRLHLALKPGQIPARLVPTDLGADTVAGPVTPGKAVVGTLAKAATPMVYPLTAKKGEVHLIRVEGRALGFPIDPVMRLLKADGSEIRKEDDSNKTSDPEYLWTVSADGDYQVEVSDRFSRGGPEMRYRLTLSPSTPDFTATLDKAQYAMERGKPLEIKATVTRLRGHKEKLVASVTGLPAGITLTAPEVPEKGGEVILKLEAKADAAGFSGPLRVVFKEEKAEGAKSEKTAVFSFKDDNYRGAYAIDEIESVWLALPPVKEEPKKEAPKKEEKKEEKKPEPKKEEPKKPEAKKEEPKKPEARKEEPKK